MRGVVCIMFLLFALSSACSWAQDKYVGAIWSVKVKGEKNGKFEEIGRLRCTTDGKVFREGRVIGSHKNTGKDSVEMVITEAKEPKLNGKWKASLLKKDGKVLSGIFTRDSDGKEFVVVMTLEKD